jgi:hypothetical protein
MSKARQMKTSSDANPESIASVACKFCGQDGFHWLEVDGRWKLADKDQNLHSCRKKGCRPRPTETPFDAPPPGFEPSPTTTGAYFGRFTTMLQVLPAGWRVELERKMSGGWMCRVLVTPLIDNPEWHDGIQPADALFRALSAVPSEDNMNEKGEPCSEALGYPTSTV